MGQEIYIKHSIVSHHLTLPIDIWDSYGIMNMMASIGAMRGLIQEGEMSESEAEELDRLAKETREKGVSWKSLKAELGL